MARTLRKQGYAAPRATGVPAPLARVARTTPPGGGNAAYGTGDRTRNTDTRFRQQGVMHNLRSIPRNKKPRVSRFEYPYIPGQSRRRA